MTRIHLLLCALTLGCAPAFAGGVQGSTVKDRRCRKLDGDAYYRCAVGLAVADHMHDLLDHTTEFLPHQDRGSDIQYFSVYFAPLTFSPDPSAVNGYSYRKPDPNTSEGRCRIQAAQSILGRALGELEQRPVERTRTDALGREEPYGVSLRTPPPATHAAIDDLLEELGGASGELRVALPNLVAFMTSPIQGELSIQYCRIDSQQLPDGGHRLNPTAPMVCHTPQPLNLDISDLCPPQAGVTAPAPLPPIQEVPEEDWFRVDAFPMLHRAGEERRITELSSVRTGDSVSLTVTANHQGWAHLLSIGPNGEVYQLAPDPDSPNPGDRDTRLQADQPLTLGPYPVEDPPGTERLELLVSTSRLSTEALLDELRKRFQVGGRAAAVEALANHSVRTRTIGSASGDGPIALVGAPIAEIGEGEFLYREITINHTR